MLRRVLGVDREGVDVDTLRQLVENAQPESQSLEYKSELPGGRDQDKIEFLRDVTAMVNGGGGILIYGIGENANVAANLSPISLRGVETKLRQLMADRIQPPIRFDVIVLEEALDSGYVIVELASSVRVPHCLTIDSDRYVYPVRIGTDRRPMTPMRVGEEFRSQFNRVIAISTQLTNVVWRNLEHRKTDHPYARAYIGAIPLEDQGRLFTVLNDSTLQTMHRPEYFLGRYPVIPPTHMRGFQSVRFARHFDESLDSDGFMELDVAGTYVNIIPSASPGGQGEPAMFGDFELACSVIAAIEGLHALHSTFGVDGPLMVVYGIGPVGLPATLEMLDRKMPSRTEPIQLGAAIEASVDWLLDGSSELDRMKLAKSVLDDLFGAFGRAGCELVTADGVLSNMTPNSFRHPIEELNRRLRQQIVQT